MDCDIHRRYVAGGKEGCSWASTDTLGVRLGDWIWRGGGSGEGLQLAYTVSFLSCLTGVFPVKACWVIIGFLDPFLHGHLIHVKLGLPSSLEVSGSTLKTEMQRCAPNWFSNQPG